MFYTLGWKELGGEAVAWLGPPESVVQARQGSSAGKDGQFPQLRHLARGTTLTYGRNPQCWEDSWRNHAEAR